MRRFHSRPSRRQPFDLASLVMAPIGVALVFLAQSVAGIPMRALLQVEAALIVFGGTAAALLMTYTPRDLVATIRATLEAFRTCRHDFDALAASLMGFAIKAHRRGLVSLDADVDAVAEPFLRDGLAFAIDEPSDAMVREILAVESASRTADEEAPARVLEAAAGYAPTLGILGAVLGLIQVMRTVGDGSGSGIGKGIAVAFIATVYGVGVANLVLLPLAGRLRERAAHAARRRELMTVGICAIHARLHPRLVAQKLRSCGVDARAVSTGTPVRTSDAGVGATGFVGTVTGERSEVPA